MLFLDGTNRRLVDLDGLKKHCGCAAAIENNAEGAFPPSMTCSLMVRKGVRPMVE